MSQPTATAIRAVAVAINDAKLDADSLTWTALWDEVVAHADANLGPDNIVTRRIQDAVDAPTFRAACAEAVLDLHRNHPGVLG